MTKSCSRNDGERVIKYLFFGGCTTLVNYLTYCFFRLVLDAGVTASNVISVAAAITFAFFVNRKYVFQCGAESSSGILSQFIKFVSCRLLTMVIEIGGVWLMVELLHINDFISKLLIQILVVILNYLISRFLVFR